ncbi:MAG: exonuclease domain-containing protein [bacterium]
MARVNRFTPLAEIKAVVLDTETTGLDVSSARLVQLSAVRFEAGQVLHDQCFDQLINPRVPIPPAATAVHRITDAMVAGAPTFAEVKPAFDAFAGDAVLIGQRIGFDLAVLLRETERIGERWQPPRFLDTKLLAAALDREAREFGLDALATRYGVTISDRHRALGDALVTAEVFAQLLPRLLAAGISTLADAEAHSNAQTRIRARQAAAGWYDVTSRRSADAYESGRETLLLERLDTFPYRHRVEHVMVHPPTIVAPSTSLAEAVRLMVDQDLRVLLAGDPGAGRADGIVTQSDVLRAIARDGAAALAHRVDAVMSEPVASLPRDAFLYRALARMQRLGVQHLAVQDAAGRAVGLLSLRSLVPSRAADALVLGDELSTARSPRELASAQGKLADMARHLLADGVDVHEIAAVVSAELHELLGRAAAQAEQRMESQGDGRPPVPYALVALGRDGRGECLLAPRHEHALVYESGGPDGFEDRWFAAFAAHLDDVLRAAGTSPRDDVAGATQAAWRRSLAEWRGEIRRWTLAADGMAAAAAGLFDFTFVFGDESLATDLRDLSLELAAEAPAFVRALAPGRDPQPPAASQGRFDLVQMGVAAIEAAARALALAARIPARPTAERLVAAATRTGISSATADELIETHERLLGLMLGQQLDDLSAGLPASYTVDVAALAAAAGAALTAALERSARVGDLVRYALALL